jgi:hypothetical protein
VNQLREAYEKDRKKHGGNAETMCVCVRCAYTNLPDQLIAPFRPEDHHQQRGMKCSIGCVCTNEFSTLTSNDKNLSFR